MEIKDIELAPPVAKKQKQLSVASFFGKLASLNSMHWNMIIDFNFSDSEFM